MLSSGRALPGCKGAVDARWQGGEGHELMLLFLVMQTHLHGTRHVSASSAGRQEWRVHSGMMTL
jgi:hypothetical protein